MCERVCICVRVRVRVRACVCEHVCTRAQRKVLPAPLPAPPSRGRAETDTSLWASGLPSFCSASSSSNSPAPRVGGPARILARHNTLAPSTARRVTNEPRDPQQPEDTWCAPVCQPRAGGAEHAARRPQVQGQPAPRQRVLAAASFGRVGFCKMEATPQLGGCGTCPRAAGRRVLALPSESRPHLWVQTLHLE